MEAAAAADSAAASSEMGVDDDHASTRPLRRLRRGTEDEETCVICFSWPKRKAALDGCGHTSFCLACITTWAETNNCCPVCRTRFTVVSDPADPSCHIPVEHAEPPRAEEEEAAEEWARCTLCHQRDREVRVRVMFSWGIAVGVRVRVSP